MTYANETKVPVQQTRQEIERVLNRYGATGFAYGSQPGRAMIMFETMDRRIRFVLPLVPPATLNEKQASQFERSRWRGLLLSIKAKLEAVESGIETFDEAFLSHVVMPNGKTMAEHLIPYLEDGYSRGKMPPLLGFG